MHNRKNYVFAGSDAGGERAAAFYSLSIQRSSMVWTRKPICVRCSLALPNIPSTALRNCCLGTSSLLRWRRPKPPPDMSGESIKSFVDGTERLRAFYSGAWPCFHDAEIVEMHLWRGHVYPGEWDNRNVFPILTLKVLILEATQPNATSAGNDVLATLRFHSVDQVRLQDFNHNNSIVDIAVSSEARGFYTNGEPLPPALLMTIEQGFGLAGSFSCTRIEIVTAECSPTGPLGEPHS